MTFATDQETSICGGSPPPYPTLGLSASHISLLSWSACQPLLSLCSNWTKQQNECLFTGWHFSPWICCAVHWQRGGNEYLCSCLLWAAFQHVKYVCWSQTCGHFPILPKCVPVWSWVPLKCHLERINPAKAETLDESHEWKSFCEHGCSKNLTISFLSCRLVSDCCSMSKTHQNRGYTLCFFVCFR